MNHLLKSMLKKKEIGHFRIHFLPLFQNDSESSCKTFHIKNEFDLPENEPVGGRQFHSG